MQDEKMFLLKQLPEPLNSSELNELLKQYQETHDEKIYEKLILHNIKMVIKIVNRDYYNTPFEKEDLISIGLIGLMKAINRFDVSKGFQFSTLAYRCINTSILGFLKKNTSKIMFEEDLYTITDDGEEVSVLDRYADTRVDLERDIEEKDFNLRLRTLLEEAPISDDERKIIKLRFGLDDDIPRTFTDITKILGIKHRQSVERKFDIAMKKISVKMKKLHYDN